MKTNSWSITYAVIWLTLIAVEVSGALWKFHPMDTMTQNYRWAAERWPWLNIVLFIGLCVLYWHLAIQKPKV
jgi:hypothetical protein